MVGESRSDTARTQIGGCWESPIKDTPVSTAIDDRDSAVTHINEFVDGYAAAATRTAYRSDLTLWLAHCRRLDLELFEVRRADIEGYARQLETEELAPGYGQSAAGDHHRVLPVGAGRGAGHGQPGRQRPQATAR